MQPYNLCIIKPNASSFSETFIQEHINRLAGNKRVLYGGAFPVYHDNGKYLIRSKLGLLIYLFQKRVLKKMEIPTRNKALARYLREESIDVVFAEYGTVGAMVAKACEMARVPLVVHYHGADAHHRPTVKKYRYLYQRAFKYAAAIVTVSLDMNEALKELGAPERKLICIPCGVNTDLFPQIDISQSLPNFISVGRFVEKKSPLSIIEAFAIVLETIPDARLWMVGDGPLFSDAKNLITQLKLSGKVFLTGILKSVEIAELFRQMRCFVQHSVRAADGDMEGTPVTVLEAASSALPIVATAHAGIKQTVVDGVTGYLVPEHDITSMSAKMIDIASSPALAKKLGMAGRQHIINKYSILLETTKLDEVIGQSMLKSIT